MYDAYKCGRTGVESYKYVCDGILVSLVGLVGVLGNVTAFLVLSRYRNCNQRPQTKRQATQHGCLPSLLGDVVGEGKKCTGTTRAAKRQNKNLVYQHDKPNEPPKRRPPFICPL